MAEDFISFATDTLDREPVRLPILARGPEWFVLNKPAGVAWTPDPFIPKPSDIVREVRRAIREGKGQLTRLGIDGIHGIAGPDLIASGAVLFARTDAEAARLANAQGSSQVELTYRMVTPARTASDRVVCDLPLAPHATEPRIIVSQSTGKKTTTVFEVEKRFRGYAVWTATTTFNRHHQVRVHAAESRLPIVGEWRYAHVNSIHLSELKRDYRETGRAERPLYSELCLHLARIRFPGADGALVTVECPLPKGFAVLLRRLEEHAGL